ncbi:MAG: hypothetical protein GEV11_11390 [Streptosporangiales bacterium]|nr:hypothetical protein [Streptosporangiales bacterium]
MMGDFVGMDPGGVRRLASALRDMRAQAAMLKPILGESIEQAGRDFPGGPGTVALDRLIRFADESAADIDWRVATLERMDRSRDGFGMLSGDLPFPSLGAAKQSGLVAGAEGRRLWEAYRRDPSGANRQALREWLRGVGTTKTRDAEYASAMLGGLGRANFKALVTDLARGSAGGHGLSADELEGVRADLEPIAEAVASAEAAGRLRAEIRDEVLNGIPIAGLSAMLALADQPRSLLVPTARVLVQHSDAQGAEPNWNNHWTVGALARDPLAMQEFMGRRSDLTLLLRPSVTKGTHTPGFERLLAQAMNGATAPGSGDAGLRREAYINTVNVLADKNMWPTLRDSPLNRVLAENSGQYLPQLAGIAAAHDENAPEFHPGKPWDQVKSDTAGRFFAGVLQEPTAAPILRDHYRAFVRDLDLTDADPFGRASDPAVREVQRAKFHDAGARAGGLGSLFLDGIAQADLSYEERREALESLVGLPVTYIVNSAVGAPGLGGQIQEELVNRTVVAPVVDFAFSLNDKDYAQASVEMERLVDTQLARLADQRHQDGLPALSKSDQGILRNYIQGLYAESMVRSLAQRGG